MEGQSGSHDTFCWDGNFGKVQHSQSLKSGFEAESATTGQWLENFCAISESSTR